MSFTSSAFTKGAFAFSRAPPLRKIPEIPMGSTSIFHRRSVATVKPVPKSAVNNAPSKAAALKVSEKQGLLGQNLPKFASANSYLPRKAQKELLAKRLFESGEDALYRAPSQVGFLLGSFIATGSCVMGVGVLLLNGYWEAQEDLSWIVPFGNRLTIACFSFLAGWLVLRCSRHITAINLHQKDNRIMLLVTVRRTIPLPFVQPRKIITEPSDFVLPSRMVTHLEVPKWAEEPDAGHLKENILTRLRTRISMASWNFFAGSRKVFTHEGFMDVKIRGESGLWKLDTAGKFAKGGRNLRMFNVRENPSLEFPRRYGEVDWQRRPTVDTAGPGLFNQHVLVEDFPDHTNESYEEWKVNTMLQSGFFSLQDDLDSVSFCNPLALLQNSESMVDFLVGPLKSRWHLHEALLIKASTFVKAAVTQPFKEKIERCISLPEEDPLVFAFFVQHLYTGSFHTNSLDLLLPTYALGDKLGASRFQSHALDNIYNQSHKPFTVKQILWIFDNTASVSGLKRLCVDLVGSGIISNKIKYSTEEWESLVPVLPDLMQGVVSMAEAQKGKEGGVYKNPRLTYNDQ